MKKIILVLSIFLVISIGVNVNFFFEKNPIFYGATPGYSTCGRCGSSWDRVNPHDTPYSEEGGCFSLCEICWSQLTPKTRLPYYKALWVSRDLGFNHPKWRGLERAVLNGE